MYYGYDQLGRKKECLEFSHQVSGLNLHQLTTIKYKADNFTLQIITCLEFMNGLSNYAF